MTGYNHGAEHSYTGNLNYLYRIHISYEGNVESKIDIDSFN
jgi:hypothetical protein